MVGTALRGARQIPVVRGTRDSSSLDRAVEALEAGEVVVIYPEGTVTTRHDGLPMDAKTGVARLALRSGVPVVPIASWGSQAVWQKSGKGSLRFGRPILTAVGEPLVFERDPDAGPDRWRAVTTEVMAAITDLVVRLRDRYPRSWR